MMRILMNRLPFVVVLAFVFVVGALGLGTSASAQKASRIIDRTLSCMTLTRGGVYEIEARAHAGVRESRSKWAKLPFAVFSTGGTASAATVLNNSLAWITAGRPSATTTLGDYRFPVNARAYGTLAVNRRICRTVSSRISLSTAGLQGGAADGLGDVFDCASPRRVLVRVRAALASPAALQGHERFVLTATPVREAKLVVRTQAGKALAYADVFESGKARVFTAPSCVPD